MTISTFRFEDATGAKFKMHQEGADMIRIIPDDVRNALTMKPSEMAALAQVGLELLEANQALENLLTTAKKEE